MRKCVFLLPSLLVAACSPPKDPANPPPTEEAYVQPLVVGHSPPPSDAPIAVAPEPPGGARSDDPVGAAFTTLEVRARDPRLAKGTPRPASKIVGEVQQLEALFLATAMTAPDRPTLARRVAEDYAELARVTEGPTAAAAHKHALRYYELITKDHPQYAQIDEALYYAALGHELGGNARDARRMYYELIKRAPSSKLIALAYFAFGELFFAEAVGDPSKNDLAEQAFKEVLKYPASANTVYPDALLRLGQLSDRKGEPAKAAAMFAKLQRDFPTSDAAKTAGSASPRRP